MAVTHRMHSPAVSQHHTGCQQHLSLSLGQTLQLSLGWILPLQTDCAQSLSSALSLADPQTVLVSGRYNCIFIAIIN